MGLNPPSPNLLRNVVNIFSQIGQQDADAGFIDNEVPWLSDVPCDVQPGESREIVDHERISRETPYSIMFVSYFYLAPRQRIDWADGSITHHLSVVGHKNVAADSTVWYVEAVERL